MIGGEVEGAYGRWRFRGSLEGLSLICMIHKMMMSNEAMSDGSEPSEKYLFVEA